MYTKYTNYYEWKNLEIPDNGRKFFHCDIANDFTFTYFVFIPKEIKKDH